MEIKNLIYCVFESVSGGPDNLLLSVRFSFSINWNRSVLNIFYLSGFCCVLFLIHDEYGIGLNVEFPNRSTS